MKRVIMLTLAFILLLSGCGNADAAAAEYLVSEYNIDFGGRGNQCCNGVRKR